MRLGTLIIVAITTILVGLIVRSLCNKPRRKGTLIRILRRPVGKKCGLSNSTPCNYDVLQIENEHPNAQGIISGCLFIKGDRETFNKRYLNPLLKMNHNRKSLKWYYRMYVPVDFDVKVKQLLLSQDFEVVTMASKAVSSFPFFWRFLPVFETKPFVCCDADNDFWSWTWNTVERWLRDDQDAFVYFPMPGLHFFWPITGPAWGCNPKHISNFDKKVLYEKMMQFSQKCCTFGCDELFLAKYIYPCFKKYGCVKQNAALYLEFGILCFLIIYFFISCLPTKITGMDQN
jgi:hypothetical protein